MLSTGLLSLPLLVLPQELPTPRESVAQEHPREVLFVHGGRIHLGNDAGGVVEALLIEDGRVVATGREQTLRRRLPEEGFGQIDLRGAVAVPGLQDAHGSLERLGRRLEWLDLSDAAGPEEVVERVRAAVEVAPKGGWILGAGWDEQGWALRELPHHAALSEVAPDHPVYLERAGGHGAWVNLAALELAGLDGSLELAPRIPGGRVRVDGEHMATGVLLGPAVELVRAHLPQPERGDLERWILAAQELLLAEGVTCVHEMGLDPERVELYEALLATGKLDLRVVGYLDGNAGLSEADLETYPRRFGDQDALTVLGVFFRLDGDLATRGAALLADYDDAPGERGELWLSEERLTLLVHEAWQAGLQPAIAAVGDRANRVAIDTYDRMIDVDEGFRRLRPRIEQAQVISTADFPRFPGLDIVPSMQPVHWALGDAWLVERLGQRRSRDAFGWRSLAPGLSHLAFGSGSPRGPSAPLLGIHAARTRRDAQRMASDDLIGVERLDGLGALAGFTRSAAYAVHQEDRRGQLSPGYWADLTVLDVDPVEAEADALREGRVLLTVIGGRVVHGG